MITDHPTKERNRAPGLPRVSPAPGPLKFAREGLSLAISKIIYLLQEIKIQGRKQSRIHDHFFVEKQ